VVTSAAGGAKHLALLSCVFASGCYLGSARNTTPAELAREGGWEVVETVADVRQVTRGDCGAAALAMVLNYWGHPSTRDEIGRASMSTGAQGIRADDLRAFARGLGMQAFLIRGQPDDLDREVHLHRPLLVGLSKRYFFRSYPHYEVVVGLNRHKRRVLTLDPAHGLRINNRDDFVAEWSKAGRPMLVVFPQSPDLQSEATSVP
jgi:ABC-type bacteriocin/lantibiotic exporter with double-glycine peptidase domain